MKSEMASSHPLLAPQDLRDLRELLSGVRGPIVRVGRSYGDELEVEFGSAERPWLLGTQASPWALAEESGRPVVSSDDREAFDRLSAELSSQVVESVDVPRDDGLDLNLRLGDGRTLCVQVRSDSTAARSPYPEPPYWELITPEQLLVAAGPGPGWVRYPADLPESMAPLPAFGASDPRRRLQEVATRIQRRHRLRAAAIGLVALSVLLQIVEILDGSAWIESLSLGLTTLAVVALLRDAGADVSTRARSDARRPPH